MITVYTTKTCPSCVTVKKLLDMKGIEYNTVDVSDDNKLRQELMDKTGMMSVPVTVKGNWEEFVVGYSPRKLMELIS